MAIVFPTIHLNGTSIDRLIEDIETAIRALGAAIEAVCDAGPNARDYYPQGPTAWPAADDAHRARITKLREIREELHAIHMNICDQDNEHKARKSR